MNPIIKACKALVQKKKSIYMLKKATNNKKKNQLFLVREIYY